MISDAVLGKVPVIPNPSEFVNAQKSNKGAQQEKDFESMVTESTRQRQQEIEKEKAAVGGDFHAGETKTDREFRESLEKVTGKKQDRLKNKLEKDDFINLMVTELKYQDPTKPMENKEMATQLAQFNTVEQLLGINKLLTQMNQVQAELKSDRLTNYIGKVVRTEGDSIKIDGSGKVSDFSLRMQSPAATANLQIKSATGDVVRSMSLGALEEGEREIKWDGKDDKGVKLPAGSYHFSVQAASEDGKEVAAKGVINAKVEGITDLASGGKLDTAAGAIELSRVLSVRDPERAPAARSAPTPAPAPAVATAPAPVPAPVPAVATAPAREDVPVKPQIKTALN